MAQAPKTIGQKLRGTKRADDRVSAARRGYGRRWAEFRAALYTERLIEAAQHGRHMCEDCEAEGKPHFSGAHRYELHHLRKVSDRPDLMYEQSNCVFLCKRHHSQRTKRGE